MADRKSSFQYLEKEYVYYSIGKLKEEGYPIERLPFTIRILLESLLRKEDGFLVSKEQIDFLANWNQNTGGKGEIPFFPSRVLLQDFTGVPTILDLSSLRGAILKASKELGIEDEERLKEIVARINPEVQVDLVIDHSIQVDTYGTSKSLEENSRLEFHRNKERYEFLHWAEEAFENFKVVPPASGIVHQVNLEYLAQVVASKKEEENTVLFPDTLVGTDSHTTMVNGLGVLGWGVGGIEAEAAMLGQPSYISVPEVIGVRLTGQLQDGIVATDLALYITKLLREVGVVNKFVEYFGEGVKNLTLADRSTVANMAPEYGATCGFFPVDEETLNYLSLTGRSSEEVGLVKTYLEQNEMFQTGTVKPEFTKVIEVDLGKVERALSGPKRPQDYIALTEMTKDFSKVVEGPLGPKGYGFSKEILEKKVDITLDNGKKISLQSGAVVLASITSCTNTSNPAVMIGAGLLAKQAVEKGLQVPEYVKTSLAPGSKAVTTYLEAAGLQNYLDQLGFQVVGYGCATCIGNSGPLRKEVASAIKENDLLVSSVLSGNRNFEGRIHPQIKANYLASPILVVAYAIAGNVQLDLSKDAIGISKEGEEVYLKDIWPSSKEISDLINTFVTPAVFKESYKEIYKKNEVWNQIKGAKEQIFLFDEKSNYIKEPPFLEAFSVKAKKRGTLEGLKVLLHLKDSVTTDHISPAGVIGVDSPAGRYLIAGNTAFEDFNTYGSRRGNHEVMVRGTFANTRIRNQIAKEKEGGFTRYWPSNEIMTVYDASELYKKEGTGLIVLAGKDYGMGSSRDWAAKGTNLLGVKVVLAESYERIHRSNLVMMGILPLEFLSGETSESLGLNGSEVYNIKIEESFLPKQVLFVEAVTVQGDVIRFQAKVRFDSEIDVAYYENGGILPMVLREKLKDLSC